MPNYIILCKNKKRATELFDKACIMSHNYGESFRSDRKGLIMDYGPQFKVQFVSAILYYNQICRGNHKAIIIGDEEFERCMNSFQEQNKKEKEREN